MSALPAEEHAPGSVLLGEIREQPAALERLLEHSDEYAAVAAVARERGLNLVRMVGHGSSDNAASYGVYAFGLLPAWTAMRDSISLSVYYGAEIDLRGSCIVALSQSGETPDVLAYVERARSRGALTIAIPKASTPQHVRENRGALDIHLTHQDLDDLNRAFPPPTSSQELEML